MGKAISAVIIVVVLVLAGLGYYMYKNPSGNNGAAAIVATNTVDTGTTPMFVVATSTPEIPNAGVEYDEDVETRTVTRTVRTNQSAAAANRVVRPAGYHNSTYGLTVPGSYTVTQSPAGVFDGTTNTATLNFYQNGSLAFTIFVWSREQWSKLRNTETWNQDAGNMQGTYFGEGTYLGENFTWIYSILPQSGAIPAGIVFY